MKTAGPKYDLKMQLMWDRLGTVAEEQAQALVRTAFSSIVRDSGDLSTGIFDLSGRMLVQAVTGTPGHVNAMALSVQHFIRHFPVREMKRGDVFITNDPWMGTGHLNDFVVTTPCFYKNKLVALFACTSHLIDVGGLGLIPDATDVFMEGVYVPFLRWAQAGKVNDTLMAIIKANTRLPTESEGDIYSLVACNDVGVKRLCEMMDEFKVSDLDALGRYIVQSSSQAVLEEVRKLPQGQFTNSMTIDGFEREIELVAKLTISSAGINVDYEGTSKQSRFGINVPYSYAAAYTRFGLACVVVPNVPNNAGSLKPFSITAPAGSIVNAVYPAPVAARHMIGMMLPDVVFGCLAQAIPDRVPAEGTSGLWSLKLHGPLPARIDGPATYTTHAISNGGAGARPGKDGLSATAFPSGVKCSPIELTELSAPIVIWRKEYRPDSGGAGKYRGGHGLVVEVETRNGAPFDVRASFDRIKNPARGRDGGRNGASGYVGLKSGVRLNGVGRQNVEAGERLVLMTPGGAGMGSPRDRNPSAIEADLRDGVISAEAARNDYGFTDGQTAKTSSPEHSVERVQGGMD